MGTDFPWTRKKPLKGWMIAVAEGSHDRTTLWNRNLSTHRHSRWHAPVVAAPRGDASGPGAPRWTDENLGSEFGFR